MGETLRDRVTAAARSAVGYIQSVNVLGHTSEGAGRTVGDRPISLWTAEDGTVRHEVVQFNGAGIAEFQPRWFDSEREAAATLIAEGANPTTRTILQRSRHVHAEATLRAVADGLAPAPIPLPAFVDTAAPIPPDTEPETEDA